MEKIIAQGAEAILIKDKNKIIKRRIKKNYRIKEIDEKLRKFRTRREAKVIGKLQEIAPNLIKIDDEKMVVEMEYIDGKLLRDILNGKNYKKICILVGKNVAKIHEKGIIHGDLTTSNMILKANKVYFIDYGLSFFSQKIEDQAVDLHLLKQALESKHYKIWEKAFKSVLNGYKGYSKYNDVIKRLEKVEMRGRYKGKHL